MDIANVVNEALAKFKNSDEFATILKKDHDAGFDTRVEFSTTSGHTTRTLIIKSCGVN